MDPQSIAAAKEALTQAYAALNRGDIAGFVAVFDPQIVRIEPADFPQGGTYRGLDEVTAHVARGRGAWAEGSCEPEGFVISPTAGDRVVVLVQVRVRLKHETEWRQGRIADGFTFRNGKAIEFQTFGDVGQAMAWAGVEPSDAE